MYISIFIYHLNINSEKYIYNVNNQLILKIKQKRVNMFKNIRVGKHLIQI